MDEHTAHKSQRQSWKFWLCAMLIYCIFLPNSGIFFDNVNSMAVLTLHIQEAFGTGMCCFQNWRYQYNNVNFTFPSSMGLSLMCTTGPGCVLVDRSVQEKKGKKLKLNHCLSDFFDEPIHPYLKKKKTSLKCTWTITKNTWCFVIFASCLLVFHVNFPFSFHFIHNRPRFSSVF